MKCTLQVSHNNWYNVTVVHLSEQMCSVTESGFDLAATLTYNMHNDILFQFKVDFIKVVECEDFYVHYSCAGSIFSDGHNSF